MEQAGSPESEGRFALWGLVAWLTITVSWWTLAFARLPVPPVWLAQAREVCFGTLPNGLPDTWGWGSLIVSPLAVLAILLAVWGSDLKEALNSLTDRRVGMAAVVLMAAIPLVGLHWVVLRVVEARAVDTALDAPLGLEPLDADYPRGAEMAPALGLVDQTGAIVTTESLLGRPALVTFAYGHCKTICPVVVNIVREAATELSSEEVPLVVISLDPWRDTPSSLPSLAKAWKLDEVPGARILSGDVDAVLTVLDAWNMPIQRDPKTGEIEHPGLVTVLAPDGTRAYSFNSPPTRWVVEAVRRVATTDLAANGT
ncbi:MAG: SCO family protein [Deltaproteobacteria bacterium]|nr:SCO family protein [Deltaproteobacteria bacterium]